MVELNDLLNDGQYASAKDDFMELYGSQTSLGEFRSSFFDLSRSDDEVAGEIKGLYARMLADNDESEEAALAAFDDDALDALISGAKNATSNARREARKATDSNVEMLADLGDQALRRGYADVKGDLFDNYRDAKLKSLDEAGIDQSNVLRLMQEYAENQAGTPAPETPAEG
jgi:hypothetical protein